MPRNYFLKAWSVTPETVRQVEMATEILESDNQSYALRRLVALGLQALEQKEAS